MVIIDRNNCPDYNYFKEFNYAHWVMDESFTQSHILKGADAEAIDDIVSYDELVDNFENLPAVEASYAICWQQLDALRRPDLDNWTEWEELDLSNKRIEILKSQSLERNDAQQINNLIMKDAQQAIERFQQEVEKAGGDESKADRSEIEDVVNRMAQNAGELAQLWKRQRQELDQLEDKTREKYREKRETFIQRLDNLVMKYKPDAYGDDYALDKDAIVYVHLAVGLALHLEREEGRGERFWELIESALRVIKMPKTISVQPWRDNERHLSDIAYSMLTAEALIWSCLFHKNFDDRKSEQALECFANAIQYSVHGWPRNAQTLRWVYGTSDSDEMDDFIDSFYNDGYAINQAHLVGFLVPPQKAADAFARIYRENSSRTSWGELSSLCESIAEFYARRYTYDLEPDEPDFSPDDLKCFRVESEFFASDWGLEETAEARTFWEMAKALASQRLSPGELVITLREAEEMKIEDRLRLYFFPEHWDKMPEKARHALVSADREYENHRGRRPIVLDHLREAARAVVFETLNKPYHNFLRREVPGGLSDLKSIFEDDSDSYDLADLVKDLFDTPHFKAFLDYGQLSPEEKRFVNRLRGKLISLNGKANAANHEHRRSSADFDNDIRETYSEFLGIGRNGILPRLMQIYAKKSAGKRGASL